MGFSGVGSFDCASPSLRERLLRSMTIYFRQLFSGEGEMDFQVNEQTYFLTLAEDERRWQFFVSSPTTRAHQIPVYVDAPESVKLIVLEDEEKMDRMPN
jgi:hypothetical protein